MKRLLILLALFSTVAHADPRYLEVLDPAYYIQTHLDLRQFGNNHNAARDHWLRYGVNEGRDSAPWFSANSYCQRYSDVKQTTQNCMDKPAIVRHFLDHGVRQAYDASPKESWVISLQSAHHRYLANPDNGGPGREVHNRNRSIAGDWEKMTIHNLGEGCIRNGSKVAIRSMAGFYWAASNGQLVVDNRTLGSWQQFTITKHSSPNTCLNSNETISFRSHLNKYLAAEADGRVRADRDAIGDWERFAVVVHGTTLPQRANFSALNGRGGAVVSLQSFHGPFLSNESNGGANQPVSARRPLGGDWERMKIINHDEGCVRYGSTVSIKSTGGFFWSGFPDGRLMVDTSNIGHWQTFKVFKKDNIDTCLAHGDKITLKSHHNKFVSAELDGQAMAKRTQVGDWEVFSVVMGAENIPNTSGSIDPVAEMKKVAPGLNSFLDPLVGMISFHDAEGPDLEQNQVFAVTGNVYTPAIKGNSLLGKLLNDVTLTGRSVFGLPPNIRMKAALAFANNEWDLSLSIRVANAFQMTGPLISVAEPRLAFKSADVVLHAKQAIGSPPGVSAELTGDMFFKPTVRDPWLAINPTVEVDNEANLTLGGTIAGACNGQINANTDPNHCNQTWDVFDMNMLVARSSVLKLTLDPRAPSPHITGIETAIQDGLYNNTIPVDGALITDVDASPGFGLVLNVRQNQSPVQLIKSHPLFRLQAPHGIAQALDNIGHANVTMRSGAEIVVAPFAMSVGHYNFPNPTLSMKVGFNANNNISGDFRGDVNGSVVEAFKHGSIQTRGDITARSTTTINADFRRGLREALKRIPGMVLLADRIMDTLEVNEVSIRREKNNGHYESFGVLRGRVMSQDFQANFHVQDILNQERLTDTVAFAIASRFEDFGAQLLRELMQMNPANAARMAQEVGNAFRRGAPNLGMAMGAAANTLKSAGVPVPDGIISASNGVSNAMRGATDFANDIGNTLNPFNW